MKLRWSIATAAALCAVVAAGAWHLGVFSPSPYAHVASIERTAVFRDAALIAEAERGPVARAYLARSFHALGDTSNAHSDARGRS